MQCNQKPKIEDMKRYKVVKIQDCKQSTLAYFDKAQDAINYSEAWSNENNIGSLIYDLRSRRRGCRYFAHKGASGKYTVMQ